LEQDKLRHDILTELFNVGVGKAASLLSEITHKKIILHIPGIRILDCKNAKNRSEMRNHRILNGTLMVSSIAFRDELSGRANLIFPASKVRTLINLCMGEDTQKNQSDMEFTDIDLDIIKEIGNVVLNSIIGEFGNSLNIPINYSLPKVCLCGDDENFMEDAFKENIYLIILSVTFNINGTKIEGAIRIALNIKSVGMLLERIDQIGAQINE
jgi:chemotaxis protein CheC